MQAAVSRNEKVEITLGQPNQVMEWHETMGSSEMRQNLRSIIEFKI
jgi:hypothetical protein